jgi:Na(+)-translocating NADH:ubiquinone oxidoreductase C subunit
VYLGADGKKKDAEIGAFDIDVLKDYKAGLSNIYKSNSDDFEAMRAELSSWGKSGVNYPLFVLEKNGELMYVVPMVGTGLWGPIWGYVTIADDGETVVGAVFDHKSETPGLGAEINQPSFQKPFEGKTIYDERGDFTGIKVKKGGAKGSPHAVDAISGGTITSNGVTEMIMRTLKLYEPYLSSIGKSEKVQASTTEEVKTDTLAMVADSLNVEEVADSLELSDAQTVE